MLRVHPLTSPHLFVPMNLYRCSACHVRQYRTMPVGMGGGQEGALLSLDPIIATSKNIR